MAKYSTGEYGQREKYDYLEEHFRNHIEDYIIQELEAEHDSGEDPFNHTTEFLNDEKDRDDNYWGYFDDLTDKIASSFKLSIDNDLETIKKIAAIKFDPYKSESPLNELKLKLDNINTNLYKTYLEELEYQADDSFWNYENDDIWKEHLYNLQQSYYTVSNLVADLIKDFLFTLKADFIDDNYSHSWNPGDFESRYISFENKNGDELTIRLCDGHDNNSFYEDSENKEINLFDLLNRKIDLSEILNTVKDLLIDDFEEFPKFDISNRKKELESFIEDFENID